MSLVILFTSIAKYMDTAVTYEHATVSLSLFFFLPLLSVSLYVNHPNSLLSL